MNSAYDSDTWNRMNVTVKWQCYMIWNKYDRITWYRLQMTVLHVLVKDDIDIWDWLNVIVVHDTVMIMTVFTCYIWFIVFFRFRYVISIYIYVTLLFTEFAAHPLQNFSQDVSRLITGFWWHCTQKVRLKLRALRPLHILHIRILRVYLRLMY